MSTLPFLLSVADELDNINSQSYMDDFGLGFHPHRQYYRTPTIQLSLPASTDWMQEERTHRYRGHKFYYGMDNNLQSTGEENEDDAAANDADETHDEYNASACDRYSNEPSTSAAHSGRQKYTSPLRPHDLEQTDNSVSMLATTAASNNKANSNKNKNRDKTSAGAIAIATNTSTTTASNVNNDAVEDDDDNIDNSVRMYNLSKKCCKNYHRHAVQTNVKDLQCPGTGSVGGSSGGSAAGPSGYRLHSKCMEGNNSSSDESLQKVSSSIEFLTCFLLKRSRASSSSSKNATGGSSSKKS